jgi:hypothetical protein
LPNFEPRRRAFYRGRRRERLGWRLTGRPQEKAAWPSGPFVPAAPSPLVAGSDLHQSGGPDFGFAKALRLRALGGGLVPRGIARVARALVPLIR